MYYIRARMYKCTKCTSAVDMNFFGLSSLLGPPLVVCHRCGETVATDRLEWNEMPRAGKLWFFGVSLFYLALVGFLGGNSFTATVQILRDGTWTRQWLYSGPLFWLGAGLWMAFVVILQTYRVYCSLRRGRAVEHKPM